MLLTGLKKSQAIRLLYLIVSSLYFCIFFTAVTTGEEPEEKGLFTVEYGQGSEEMPVMTSEGMPIMTDDSAQTDPDGITDPYAEITDPYVEITDDSFIELMDADAQSIVSDMEDLTDSFEDLYDYEETEDTAEPKIEEYEDEIIDVVIPQEEDEGFFAADNQTNVWPLQGVDEEKVTWSLTQEGTLSIDASYTAAGINIFDPDRTFPWDEAMEQSGLHTAIKQIIVGSRLFTFSFPFDETRFPSLKQLIFEREYAPFSFFHEEHPLVGFSGEIVTADTESWRTVRDKVNIAKLAEFCNGSTVNEIRWTNGDDEERKIFPEYYRNGTCGGNINSAISWELIKQGDKAILTIWGTGIMVKEEYQFPWQFLPRPISKLHLTITVEEGITSIGASAFLGCYASEINLPASLQDIGDRALESQAEDCKVTFAGDLPEGFLEWILNEYYEEGYLCRLTICSPKTQKWDQAYQTYCQAIGDYPIKHYWCYKVDDSSCGTDSWWELTRDGTLYVQGSGVVRANRFPSRQDLSGFAASVHTVSIGPDISRIEQGTFSSYADLKEIIYNSGREYGDYPGYVDQTQVVPVYSSALRPSALRGAFTGCTQVERIIEIGFTNFNRSPSERVHRETEYEKVDIVDEQTGELVFYANGSIRDTYVTWAGKIDASMLESAAHLRDVYLVEDAVLTGSGMNINKDLVFHVAPGSQAEIWCEKEGVRYENIFEWINTNHITFLRDPEYPDRKNALSLKDLTFSFANTGSAFGYSSKYRFSQERFAAVFADEKTAQALYGYLSRWSGNCFGMCAASLLKSLYLTKGTGENGTPPQGFPRLLSGDPYPRPVSTIQWFDGNSASAKRELRELIEQLQIGQYSSQIQDTYSVNLNHLQAICSLSPLSEGSEGLYDEPFLVLIGPRKGLGHVMTAYGLYRITETAARLYVYDPNCPGEVRYILLQTDRSGNAVGWSYNNRDSVTADGQAVETEWNSSGKNAWISAVSADVVINLMKGMGGTLSNEQFMACMTAAQYLQVLDGTGAVVAWITDGEFVPAREDIRQTVIDSGGKEPGIIFYLPANGAYTIKNLSEETETICFVRPDGTVDENKITGFRPDKPSEDQSKSGSESKSDSETSSGSYFLRVNAKSVRLRKGQCTTGLKVSMQAGDRIKSVKSSKKKIVAASIKDAAKGIIRLKGKKTGKATVIITLQSGLSKKISVRVQKNKVKTKKIRPEGESKLSLKKGEACVIRSIRTPFTAQDKITYDSSKKNVAVVNKKGIVRARRKGTAKITVRSGKKKYVLTVTVDG